MKFNAPNKRVRFVLLSLLAIIFLGLLLPSKFVMPVAGASKTSYHPNSFWYYPWGRSGTHKGVDIFAKKGTRLNSSTLGIVVYKGSIKMGGKVVLVLGPKWRFHYYAHLDAIETRLFDFVKPGDRIGRVGDSGNAKGKPPHLHYSIVTMLPYIHKIDTSPQGWKKMFFLNPITYLNKVTAN